MVLSIDSVYGTCGVGTCNVTAMGVLRSRKSGVIVHACSDCASEFHEQGWEVINGELELISDE